MKCYNLISTDSEKWILYPYIDTEGVRDRGREGANKGKQIQLARYKIDESK